MVGIPAYNEAMHVGSVVLAAKQYAEEVVVVDDGSVDETGAVAREAGATVCAHDSNRGKGRAVATLLEYVDPEEIDALVLLDGDGQHRPAEIPEVVEPVVRGESDLVVGSRYIDTASNETPVYRRVGQTVLDTLTNGLAGASVSDSQSGFRALSPDAVSELVITTNGMGVESEMVLSAADNDLDVTEVSVDVRYGEVSGHSRHPVAHGLTVVALLARCVGDRYPLVCFGLPGVAVGLAGGLTGLETVRAGSLAVSPLELGLSALALAVGAVLLACGLVLSRGGFGGQPSSTE